MCILFETKFPSTKTHSDRSWQGRCEYLQILKIPKCFLVIICVIKVLQSVFHIMIYDINNNEDNNKSTDKGSNKGSLTYSTFFCVFMIILF